MPVDAGTRRIVGALIEHGRVRRAYLGVVGGPRPLSSTVAESLKRVRGLEVVQLLAGSPAARAGLRLGDVIVELGGRPVEGVSDLQRILDGDLVGRRVPIRLARGESVVVLDIEPVELRG